MYEVIQTTPMGIVNEETTFFHIFNLLILMNPIFLLRLLKYFYKSEKSNVFRHQL